MTTSFIDSSFGHVTNMALETTRIETEPKLLDETSKIDIVAITPERPLVVIRADGEIDERRQHSSTSSKPSRMVTFRGFADRPFYGRKAELESLHEVYSDFLKNSGRSRNSSDNNSTSSSNSSVEPKAAITATTTKNAVFIRGVSGCGKTALVEQFMKELQERNGSSSPAPIVLRGKYEKIRRQDPFAAIEQAFWNYLRDINVTQKQKHAIIHAIGGNAGVDVLKDIIPALNGWIGGTIMTTPQRRGLETTNNAFKSNQLNYVFKNLIQALSKQLRSNKKNKKSSSTYQSSPVILILDDMQWSDSASLDLLAYLANASLSCPFFLIGTYRTEMSADGSGGHHTLFLDKTKDVSFELTLENHNQAEITEMLSRELNCDTIECLNIASSIYERTKGNIFFTHQLVERLLRQGILRKHHDNHRQRKRSKTTSQPSSLLRNSFTSISTNESGTSTSHTTTTSNSNSGETKCTWETEDIIDQFAELNCSFSVSDTVADKINHLPNPQIKHALVLASYLGSKFDVSTLHEVFLKALSNWDNDEEGGGGGADNSLRSYDSSQNVSVDGFDVVSSSVLSLQDFVHILDVAVLEGLLYNTVGSTSYEFVHDKIQETAYGMIPVGSDRDHLLYRLGKFLMDAHLASNKLADDKSTDWMLFLAARHWSDIDESHRSDYVDPLDVAELFRKCGSKSISMTAFDEAARYFQNGIDSLMPMEPQELWESQYRLMLQLYRSSAEMELLLGNFEIGYSLGNVVLSNAKFLLDKIPTYIAMDAAMGLQERHHEALKLNMEVLKELDMAPSMFSGIRDFFQVKGLINNTTDEEILNLPEMTDAYHHAALTILGNVATRSFVCGNMLLMVTATLQGVKLLLKKGLSSNAPLVFAGYGCALLSGMGHPSTGRRMGRLAREISCNPKYNEYECKGLYLIASLIELWTEPYDKIIETFERAHRTGLLSGNLDFAYGSENEALVTSFVSGRGLSTIVQRFQSLMTEVDQYKLEALLRVLTPLGKLLFHLTRRRKGDGSLAPELPSVDWNDFDLSEELKKDSSNHHTLTWATLYAMILAYMMNYTEVLDEITAKFQRIAPAQSFFICSLGNFYSGLSNVKLYMKSKQSKHKSAVRKHTKDLKKLVEQGCTKTEHLYQILKAECAYIEKPNKHRLVQQMYDEAISSANEHGSINDQALAKELMGEFFMRQKRPEAAKELLIEACSLYNQWGAFGKVNQLLFKHQSCLSRHDLPSITAAASSSNDNGGSDCMRSISSSSIGEGSDADDLSTLNPIPENQTLGNVNRWGNGGSSQNSPGEFSSPPPQPARRMRESSDGPPAIVTRQETLVNSGSKSSPPKPPRRSSDVSEESGTGRTSSLGDVSSQDHCPVVPRRLPERMG